MLAVADQQAGATPFVEFMLSALNTRFSSGLSRLMRMPERTEW